MSSMGSIEDPNRGDSHWLGRIDPNKLSLPLFCLLVLCVYSLAGGPFSLSKSMLICGFAELGEDLWLLVKVHSLCNARLTLSSIGHAAVDFCESFRSSHE